MPSSSPVAKVLSLLGAFVATSVVLGLLGAGLVLPAVGAAGQATKESVTLFKGLPGDLEVNPLNQQSRILATDGSVIATPYDENRIVVPLKDIAPVMRQAQVAIEDERFYEHGGVDPQGIMRALASNTVSGGTQGASTLTQQYVKVVQQDQALKRGDKEAAAQAVTQTGVEGYLRKLQQVKHAVSLETRMSKDQILAGYLNTVYMGDQAYGVEAAARNYFDTTAAELTLPQAALLAGVVQRPGATDPIQNPEAAKARRNVVIRKMADLNMVSSAEAKEAIESPLGLKDGGRTDQSCASSDEPYFCYYVQEWLMDQPALGKTPKERLATLRSGGLVIQTSLNPKRVKAMKKEITKRVPIGNDEDVFAASVQVEPGTGLVTAMAQNTEYSNTGGEGKTSLNLNAPSGGLGFAPGSSIKAFALVEALQQGRSINSTVDVPRMTARNDEGSPRAVFRNDEYTDECSRVDAKGYPVGNSHPSPAGPMSLERATGESVNTAFVQLVRELGACKVRDTITDLGVTKISGEKITVGLASIALGSDSVSPLALTNAYAAIASGGMLCEPRPVKSIKTPTGKPLKVKTEPCKRVMSKDVAYGAAKLLHAPLELDAGSAKNAKLDGGRDAFGKTGTTNNAKETWFVGATPQLATGVYVGRFDSDAPLKAISLPGFSSGSDFVYGGDLAAPIWKSVMDASLEGMPKKKFPEPSGKATKPTSADEAAKPQVTVPNVAGMTYPQAAAALEAAGFDSIGVGNGTVGGTEPSAGSKAERGSGVRLLSSNQVYD